MPNEITAKLQKLLQLQAEIAHIHPSLEHPYPVALASGGGELTVYDLDREGRAYRAAARMSLPMPIPDKVRAAFPLEEYDGRMVCVVTEDIFSEPGGYITIFHEFVHCYQFHTVEPRLRQTLSIARRARERQDFMWEINYPFPYRDEQFEAHYSAFLQALAAESEWAAHEPHAGEGEAAAHKRRAEEGAEPTRDVAARRQAVKDILAADDLEYMVWQEWKEGFARYIENELQAHFGLPVNTRGEEPPFSRVSFYAGGAAYIRYIARREPELISNLEALFSRIRG